MGLGAGDLGEGLDDGEFLAGEGMVVGKGGGIVLCYYKLRGECERRSNVLLSVNYTDVVPQWGSYGFYCQHW